MPEKGSPKSSSSPPLEEYRAKRSAQTPEPLSSLPRKQATKGLLFVVQKHAARRTHYDLRLEMDGVLKSWAVPRGPSPDPAEKRLAVETEDHPFEYGDFEGLIPAGNYGAGAMIVWDRGSWTPLEDATEGWRKGKLLFELRGYKLRGTWTLFRTQKPAIHRGKDKDEDRQWLLVKKPDAAARPDDPDGASFGEQSVLSGLTVEELASGPERVERVLERIESLAPPKRNLDVRRLKPMLAQAGRKPFSKPGWVFELKYDGYRLLAAVDAGTPYLRYRSGGEATHLFPEITTTLSHLPVASMVVDGEVVVLDADGRPSFQRLQRRAMLSRALEIEQAAMAHPATYYVFDLLAFDGFDLRKLPLGERKSLLRELVPQAGPVRFSDHVEEKGQELYQKILELGVEGMVAKDVESPYVPRRSTHWLKYRVQQTDDFIILGSKPPKDTRSGFRSLHLAAYRIDDKDGDSAPRLVYAGRVGSGFDEHELLSIAERLESIRVDEPTECEGLPIDRESTWVEPKLVCEVRYGEWTEQGILRHPVFLRLRDDKEPAECIVSEHVEEPVLQPRADPTRATSHKLQLTNLDKIFWPEDGFTKGDLLSYYEAVAPYMLPYLEDRPVVLTRYPDGIHGKNFFQKNAPGFAPEWIRTETVWSEGSERDIDYFVCNDTESLLYLVNLGTIPFHVWSSRAGSLDRPDWCILDLDPKEAPFSDVVKVAKKLHTICDEIGMPSFAKTSGSTGIHILLPLARLCTYEQARDLALLLAQIVCRENADIATLNRNPSRREGKVYIDFVQNGQGRLIVAPFSVRPRAGATVSTPLRWTEVNSRLSIEKHDIKTVPKRLSRQKIDPMKGLLTTEPDLLAVLERLQRRMS